MSSRKGKNTGKENKEKDKGVLLWDNQSLREKGKGKKKNREWRVVRDSQSPREKGRGKKTETKELLETVRVQQRRVNGKKKQRKNREERVVGDKESKREEKIEKMQRKNREERFACSKSVDTEHGKKLLKLWERTCRQSLAHSLPNPRRRRKTHCFALKVDEEEWFSKFLVGSFVLYFFYINLFDIVGDSSSPLR